MQSHTLSENLKIVEALAPQVAGALTGDYINMDKANKVLVLVDIQQANAATSAITLWQATTVAAAGDKVLANAVPIFLVADAATSDAWVRQTDDVGFTTSAGTTHKMIAFEVKASDLDVAGGFKCLAVKIGASNVANIVAAQYICGMLRFGIQSSLIVD
jgi:hypothetical protein